MKSCPNVFSITSLCVIMFVCHRLLSKISLEQRSVTIFVTVNKCLIHNYAIETKINKNKNTAIIRPFLRESGYSKRFFQWRKSCSQFFGKQMESLNGISAIGNGDHFDKVLRNLASTKRTLPYYRSWKENFSLSPRGAVNEWYKLREA